jgi:transposase InsO family protein
MQVQHQRVLPGRRLALRWGMIAKDAQRRLEIDDLTDFNLELLRYLAWYNLERPHFSLTTPIPGRKTPHLLSPVQFLHQNHQCNMY